MYKPLLKWVGGKTQIIDTVLCRFPKSIENYHEVFLGGGSVLFSLLHHIENGHIEVSGSIYASDVNANLIYFYQNVQNDVDNLIKELDTIVNDYKSCKNKKTATYDEAKISQESYYYGIRCAYNALNDINRQSSKASAMFLFLNKTGFRGLYRENSKGEFNVPFGNYVNPSIYDVEHLLSVSKMIRNVKFSISSFEDALQSVSGNDFIYLDPPYAPECDTSFTSYTSSGFTIRHHNRLFDLCHMLTDKKIKWLMSNADVKLVNDTFADVKYSVDVISCRRSINSKQPDAKTNEVLIWNW